MLQKDLRQCSRATTFSGVAAWVVFAALPGFAADTALDRYVKQPDPTYSYRIADTVPGAGFTSYIVEMTSQTWRKPTEVDRTVWKHWLTIVKPDRVDGTTAYLYITGGFTKDKAPNGLNATYIRARTSKRPVRECILRTSPSRTRAGRLTSSS